MAKGQFTEEDARASMKALGGFSSALSSTAPKRDSPFRNSIDEPLPNLEIPRPKPAASVSPVTRELVSVEVTENVAGLQPVQPPITITANPEMPRHNPQPVRPRQKGKAIEAQVTAETDEEFENITLPIQPELRDATTRLARNLHRRRAEKVERITANTIMRASIQFIVETLSLDDSDRPSSENEVFEMLRQKFKRS